MKRLLPVLFTLLLVGAACGDDGGNVTSEGTGSVSGTGTGSVSGTGTGSGSAANLDLITSGTLTVCSDIPYAPFEFEENGKVVGIDADLMRAMGEDLGLEVTFRDTDFDGIFAALKAKSCDVIASSVSITDERKAANDFTDGYYEINQSLLVRANDASKYDDLDDLKGETVGVQSGTTGADFAQERADQHGYQVKEFSGADDLFTALKAGQVEAALQDLPVNAYNAKTSGETKVVKVFTDTEKEEYGFVVRKGNTSLLEALNKALAELRENGQYDRIIEQYLGDLETQS